MEKVVENSDLVCSGQIGELRETESYSPTSSSGIELELAGDAYWISTPTWSLFV